jgi:hypothetical protein
MSATGQRNPLSTSPTTYIDLLRKWWRCQNEVIRFHQISAGIPLVPFSPENFNRSIQEHKNADTIDFCKELFIRVFCNDWVYSCSLNMRNTASWKDVPWDQIANVTMITGIRIWYACRRFACGVIAQSGLSVICKRRRYNRGMALPIKNYR